MYEPIITEFFENEEEMAKFQKWREEYEEKAVSYTHLKLQTECHVVKYRHMRVQSIVLEHHCDVSVLRGNVVHALVFDEQL